MESISYLVFRTRKSTAKRISFGKKLGRTIHRLTTAFLHSGSNYFRFTGGLLARPDFSPSWNTPVAPEALALPTMPASGIPRALDTLTRSLHNPALLDCPTA